MYDLETALVIKSKLFIFISHIQNSNYKTKYIYLLKYYPYHLETFGTNSLKQTFCRPLFIVIILLGAVVVNVNV